MGRRGQVHDELRVPPVGGSIAAFVFASFHSQSEYSAFGASGQYWQAKAKQGIYATVYSAMFEIGPLSEASIGNVGKTKGQMTYCDFVVTPAMGLVWSVWEDAIQAKLVAPVRRNHLVWGNTLAVLLNPTRAVANVMGGRAPWHAPDWSTARD